MAEVEALFGTDGYRGVYNTRAVTGINGPTFGQLAYEFGTLTGEKQADSHGVIVIGSDTRPSGAKLRNAAIKGAMESGAEVWDLGIAPTPTIAYIAQKYDARAIAITASHNPASNNGIKVFERGGTKADEITEDEIERRYWNSLHQKTQPEVVGGSVVKRAELRDMYLSDLITKLGGDNVLAGKNVIIDGAHGAVYDLAPRLYRALGAEVIEFACTPDGKNINENSGAASLNGVRDFIRKRDGLLTVDENFLGAFASDGDGDRVMGVDVLGREIDGNHWMYQLAEGQKGIVGTLYTNTATRRAIETKGVEFIECNNGDKYVTRQLQNLTALRGAGFIIGGEPSGHVVNLKHLSNGDGLYMGALMAVALAREDGNLADIYNGLSLWPTTDRKIHVGAGSNAVDIVASPAVQDAKSAVEEKLGTDSRVVVRPSGTEAIIRVSVESEDGTVIDDAADQIAQAVRAAA